MMEFASAMMAVFPFGIRKWLFFSWIRESSFYLTVLEADVLLSQCLFCTQWMILRLCLDKGDVGRTRCSQHVRITPANAGNVM
jgi:hypothetical protein